MRNWEGIEGWNFVFDVPELMFSTDWPRHTGTEGEAC